MTGLSLKWFLLSGFASIQMGWLGVLIPYKVNQMFLPTVTYLHYNRKTRDIKFEHMMIFKRPQYIETNIKYLKPIHGRGRGHPNIYDSKNDREFIIDINVFDDDILYEIGYMGGESDSNEFNPYGYNPSDQNSEFDQMYRPKKKY